MIKVSAPGKVHLIGEHAVVYGEPAILAAVGMRTTAEAEKSDKVIVKSKSGKYNQQWSVKDTKVIAKKAIELWESGSQKGDFSEVFSMMKQNFKQISIGTVLNHFEIDSGVSIVLDSDIPEGSGLGSSASVALVIAKSVADIYDKRVSLEDINSVAYNIEKLNHGKPSGGDNSACCYGGLLWFVKGNPNTIKSLKDEIPYKLENFVLVYTKKPEKTTGELVQQVMKLDEKFRTYRIKALGRATNEMRKALRKKDFKQVKEIINFTQKNLAELGVSIPEIDKIAKNVRDIGGAAKLCGAGGGGMMLCYHEDKNKLVDTIKSLGYKPWETDLAVEGVRVDS